jgi:hypothetical protein
MSFGFSLCNHCGKRFVSEPLVQNHQNQRTSNCWKNYNILLQAEHALLSSASESKDVQLLPSTPLPLPLSPSGSVMEVNMMDTVDAMGSMDVVEMNGVDEQYLDHDTIPLYYTKFFPGSSESFGKGKTYMDLFDDDEYAENRKTNLYYPFASQPEWELALYLLKSGLSMVAVDEFLKLQMVSAGVPL